MIFRESVAFLQQLRTISRAKSGSLALGRFPQVAAGPRNCPGSVGSERNGRLPPESSSVPADELYQRSRPFHRARIPGSSSPKTRSGGRDRRCTAVHLFSATSLKASTSGPPASPSCPEECRRPFPSAWSACRSVPRSARGKDVGNGQPDGWSAAIPISCGLRM
jgi:hypothetical protein